MERTGYKTKTRLQIEREAQGMTIAQLSRASGIGQTVISKIERKGSTHPRQKTVQMISDALGYTMDPQTLTERVRL